MIERTFAFVEHAFYDVLAGPEDVATAIDAVARTSAAPPISIRTTPWWIFIALFS
jgi:hypothetical protein